MTATGRPEPGTGRLYDLLPATYRVRDAEAAPSEPLRRLLAVVAEQLQLVEDDLDGLYDNWFIETCADWVVPYIGELVGYRSAGSAPPEPTAPERPERATLLFPRAAVANTVRARRRKGTAALLEELAADLAGWPARAVETYRLLAVTQPVHLLGTTDAVPATWRSRGGTVDLRDGERLDLLGGPFDAASHSVDVRRPGSSRTRGRHNVASVVLFAWRLRTYGVTASTAACLEDEDPHRHSFSVLGNDAPLFARPSRPPDPAAVATEAELPVPIRRRALERDPSSYLGPGRSIEIGVGQPPRPVPPDRVVAADLSGWRHRPRATQVAVDPELGRMLFAHDLLEDTRAGVTVSYRYGFSDDIGGGEYDRPTTAPEGAEVRRVRGRDELMAALAPWLDGSTETQPADAVVEIGDSAVYDVALALTVQHGRSLQLRAGPRCRPVLRLSDRTPQSDAIGIRGEKGSRVALDGLWVAGSAVRAEGELVALDIRHCTLVPGWGLGPDCEPTRPARPSLELVGARPTTCIEHSILGSIQVTLDEGVDEPVAITVADSVVDATAPGRAAVCAVGGGRAHVLAQFVRVTVIGSVAVHAVVLGENSLFDGTMDVARQQLGCLRFCSVVPGSRTPRRYQCQPDLVDALVDGRLGPGAAGDEARRQERVRVRPLWNSTRYGTPDYCQLSPGCAVEITRGADDESEMGVFHDLYAPLRADNLQAGLDEATPAGTDTAIFFAT